MRTSRNAVRCRAAGFSAAEMLLVVALSGIVFVGLTALIDVPQRMAAREDLATPSVSSSDTALAALDQDVRFATTVRVPTSLRLEADQRDGSTVVWEHSGTPGRPLTRTAAGKTVAILSNVASIGFDLMTQQIVRRCDESKPTATAGVTVSQFDTIQVKPGYSLTGARGSTPVVLSYVNAQVGSHKEVGIFLTPGSLSGDLGVPTALRIRASRGGGGSELVVQIFESDTATKRPTRANLVATGKVYARQISTTMSDLSIPLTMTRKIDGTKYYFIELSSSGGAAANVEGQTLSNPSAAVAASTAMFTSVDDGATFTPLNANTDASQTKFALDAVRVSVDSSPGVADGLPPGFQTVAIAVGVATRMALNTASGVESVKTVLPIENNLVIVRQ